MSPLPRRFTLLVLTRKELEKIQIGSDITLTVIEIEKNYVRLGIVAPREIPIHRAELLPPKHLGELPQQPDGG